MSITQTKTILFHRFFERFTGGHLKFNDYLNHANSLEWSYPSIYIDPSSNPKHLWRDHPNLIDIYDPESADILFIAGIDWRALTSFPGIDKRKTIINLIQGMRHADPDHELYGYLHHKAVRICVSQEVGNAIMATGHCNGPVHIIPNGIHMDELPRNKSRAHCDVFIAGIKRPDIARKLSNRLKQLGISVDCLMQQIPRVQYLDRISRASIAVTLPLPAEGFYLPALEAMAIGVPLVCLDCIGNRSFCLDGITCLMPSSDPVSIEQAVLQLLSNDELKDYLQQNAFAKSLLYDIERERHDFVKLLSHYAGRHSL